MNEINNLILQAVDTVVNARLAKQSKDTTIIAQIVDNNDAVFGTYTVKYQNANFDVTCNDTSKIYKKEENVYVLLPNGDINSPQKFILGSAKGVKQGDTPIVEITDPNQRYDLVGPPVFNLIKNFDAGIEAGIPGYKDFSRDIPFIYQEPKNEVKLIEYSKQYEYLQFSADFKYAPANDIKKCGNYGIEIGFFTNGDSVEDANKDKLPDQKNIIAYRFDTDSMYGDPFSAYNYTNRAVTIYCEKGTIYDLAYVTLFSEKFDRDGKIEKDDIFVKNINIQFAKLRNEADDYSANILTPYGVFINKSLYKSNGKNAVQLIPKMKYKNQGLNDVEFYWFEKNPTIDTTSDKYNSLGRRGWEDITSQANENILTYEATTDWYNKTIKLVAKYTGHIIREDEVVVYQSQEQFRIVEADNPPIGMIQLNVEKENDGNYALAGDDYTFAWEYIEVNQYVGKLNTTTSFIQLNLNELKNHNNRTYRCYISKNNSLIGIVEYLVSLNIEVQEDLQVIFEFGKDDNNNGVFLYNENGYIEIEEFTQPRQLNFSVWLGKERLGDENNNVYSYRWELPGLPNSTTKLTADYKPEDSMLIFLSGDLESEGPRKDSQKPLNYKIKPSFNRNYINNTIVLEVTYNGTTKRFPYTFSFTKQGDPGTNGTDYQMRIVPMEQGKMLQYYDSNSPKEIQQPSQLNYKLEFYYNGELDDINNYDINIKLPPQCENVVGKQNKEYVGIFNNFGLSGKIVTGSADGHNLEVTGQFPSAVTKTVTDADNKTSTYSFKPPFGIRNYTKNILMITATPKKPKEKQFKLTGILPIGISEENDNHLFKYDTTIIFNGEGYNPSYCDKALDDYFKISNTDSHYEELDRFKQSFPIGSTRRYNRFSMLEDSSLYMVKRGDENKFYLKVANQFNANEAINTLQMDDIFSFQVERKENNWQTHTHFVTSYFPLISTINQYSLMYINEWDGNSVEIKEDEGYIYAPQIGAGHKEIDKSTGDNTFTGVIMGEYVIDHEEQGVGLWGFQKGISSFGFKADGTAYIGQPGKARLEFDGENGTISSAGYVEKSRGMQLDFTNGSIYAPSFTFETKTLKEAGTTNYDYSSKFKFILGHDNSEFDIKAKYYYKKEKEIVAADKSIFKATNTGYYLESLNYGQTIYEDAAGAKKIPSTGLKIDLVRGTIDASNFSIKADGSATFAGNISGSNGEFSGSLNIAGGLFEVTEEGYVTATSGEIGGWNLSGTSLSAGATTLYSSGNITIGGSLTANGSVALNGIKISGGSGENATSGIIEFGEDNNKTTINLKDIKESNDNNANHTDGALHLQAPNGIAIETDGTLYLCSRVKDSEGKQTGFSSITMKNGQIQLYPYASAVAVFG